MQIDAAHVHIATMAMPMTVIAKQNQLHHVHGETDTANFTEIETKAKLDVSIG